MEKLSDQVADQLEVLILENALEAGDRLPSERELCELLGVSRTVVREAVRSLAAKGLLEVRRGAGTVVRAPDLKHASDVMSVVLRGSGNIAFSRVHEVRRLLEVEIAGLAAERRTDHDLLLLDALLRETLEQADEPHEWARADVSLHAAIAAATQNPLFPVLLGSMAEILMQLRLVAARLADTATRAHPHHEAVVDAIGRRHAGDARRAMLEHMNEAESTFQRARVAEALGGDDALAVRRS